jgi:hypothetical protein
VWGLDFHGIWLQLHPRAAAGYSTNNRDSDVWPGLSWFGLLQRLFYGVEAGVVRVSPGVATWIWLSACKARALTTACLRGWSPLRHVPSCGTSSTICEGEENALDS